MSWDFKPGDLVRIVSNVMGANRPGVGMGKFQPGDLAIISHVSSGHVIVESENHTCTFSFKDGTQALQLGEVELVSDPPVKIEDDLFRDILGG